MPECIECGPVVDELGYKCNHCGREVCWDHRRPGDHDCRPDADAMVAEDPTAGTTPDAVRPAEEYDFDPDSRSYPWWVYVLVAGLFVFPSIVAGAFAVL